MHDQHDLTVPGERVVPTVPPQVADKLVPNATKVPPAASVEAQQSQRVAAVPASTQIRRPPVSEVGDVRTLAARTKLRR